MIYIYNGKFYGIRNPDTREGSPIIMPTVNRELLNHSQFVLQIHGTWFNLIKNGFIGGNVDILFPSLTEFSFYHSGLLCQGFNDGTHSTRIVHTTMFVNLIYPGQEETVYNNIN